MYALVGGCVQGFVPGMWMADESREPIVTAVLWITIEWNT